MCGDFVYVHPEDHPDRLEAGFNWRAVVSNLIDQRPDLRSRFNIRPTQDVVVVFNESGQFAAKSMRWGFIPNWSKNEKMSRNTFNARDDRVAESATWRYSLGRKRGIVLANGFFEWKNTGGFKQPMYITPKEGEIFQFAALYDSWINTRGEKIDSCAIVTTPSNAFMSSIHDRMPMILDSQSLPIWLEPTITDPDRLRSLLIPVSENLLRAHPVSAEVNSYKHDSPSVIAPISIAKSQRPDGQLHLFDQ
ncbi:SOS response-associated peptidase [SAR202 cluster bacterium AD-802-L14_MRT_200m]|nr:SOS response-associated peptidase [SAR202 cluster bacterium AD-802-L14_MRT_200m]